jgi:acyl-[acyl carrier protein]--UDP-N-acetylglucosamine O-acyltransferase
MRVLNDIRKQRNQSAKEIDRVRNKIEVLYHEIEQLKEWADREIEKVNEYDIVLNHCQTLQEETV